MRFVYSKLIDSNVRKVSNSVGYSVCLPHTGRSLTPTNAWKSNRVKEISWNAAAKRSASVAEEVNLRKPFLQIIKQANKEIQPGFEIQGRRH